MNIEDYPLSISDYMLVHHCWLYSNNFLYIIGILFLSIWKGAQYTLV